MLTVYTVKLEPTDPSLFASSTARNRPLTDLFIIAITGETV